MALSGQEFALAEEIKFSIQNMEEGLSEHFKDIKELTKEQNESLSDIAAELSDLNSNISVLIKAIKAMTNIIK